MAKSIEEIEILWGDATPETKQNYLFQSICHINRKIESNKSVCVCRLKECSKALEIRVDGYKDKFVTRRQATVSLAVVFAVIVAFSIGAGLLTFNEAMNLIKP